MKTTDWFPGSVAPVREGVYRRRVPLGVYSKWAGGRWHFACATPELAAMSTTASKWQDLPWCGLAEDPAARAGGVR